jgi:tape measure domain-containing protein
MSLHYEITADNSDFKRKFAEVRQEIRSSEATATRTSQMIGGAVRQMTAALGGLFAISTAQKIVSEVQKVRDEFVSLGIAFETMLGSKEKADKIMAQAVRTAATTPFDLTQVAQGYKQLLAYGLEAEKLDDSLRSLGDVASGVGAPLNDLVYLYGTLKASGRVMTMDIRQFAGRGIPIYEELAKVLGTTTQGVMELVSAGKVGFADVEKAFQNMTSAGGRFDNLMAKQSATIAGMKAELGDAVDMLKNEYGKKMEPLMKASLKTQILIVENFNDIANTIVGLAAAYGAYRAVLMAVAAAERFNLMILRQAVLEKKLAAASTHALSNAEAIAIARTKLLTIAKQGLGKSLKSLGAALTPSPYALVAAAVAGLVFATYKLTTAASGAESVTKALNKAQQDRIETTEKERGAVEKMMQTLNDETKTRRERQSVLRELQKLYPDIFSSLDLETVKYQNLKDILREVNELLDTKSKNQITHDIDLGKQLLEDLEKYKFMISFSFRKKVLDYLGIEGFWERANIEAIDLAGLLRQKIRGLGDQLRQIEEDSFDALPREEKLNIKMKERNKLLKEYNDLHMNQNLYLPGLFDLMEMELEEKIRSVEKEIKEYGETIEVTTFKNKAYWEKEKEAAEEALAALSTNTNSAEEFAEAQSKILEIQKELDKYGVSKPIEVKKEEEEKVYSKQNKEYWENERRMAEQALSDLTKEDSVEKWEEAKTRILAIQKEIDAYQVKPPEEEPEDTRAADEERAWNEYFLKWGDFQEKRLALQKQYDLDFAEAKTEGEKKGLAKQLEADLNELDIREFESELNLADIFSNIDEKSTASIKILRDKLAAYIENAAKSMTPEQLKPIADALLNMDKILKDRDPMKGLSKSISEAKSAFSVYKQAQKDGLDEETIAKFKAAFQDAMSSVAANIDNVMGHFNEFGNIAVDGISIFSDSAGDMVGDILDIASGAGEAGLGVAQLMSGDIINGAKNLAKGIVSVVDGITKMHDKSKERHIAKLQENIDLLQESYANLSKEIEKAYSHDASNLIEQSNVMLRQRQTAIRQQIAEEKAKKKTDENRIKEWEKEISKIDDMIADNKVKAVDAIFGSDVKSAIDDFANAYVSAWGAGEDKISSVKESVKKMIQGVITEMLKADLAPTVEALRDKIKYFMTDGIIDDWERAQLDKLIEEETKRIDSKYGWADSFMKNEKDQERQGGASYGAYEKITHDQADRIDGKLTGIHLNTSGILETNRGLKSVADETYKLIFIQMEYLERIRDNTSLIRDTNTKLDKIILNTNKL